MHRRSFLFSVGVGAGAFASQMMASPLVRAQRSLFLSNQTGGLVPSQDAGTLSSARGLFYAPAGGRVGDVIPFFDGERFRIFHLYRGDEDHGGTTWQQVSTKDFLHFTEHGTMLPRGTLEDQDPSVATGSVIRDHAGTYHAFYTGYNTPMRKTRPEQGVMHATSVDLIHWTKHPADTFYAPEGTYEKDDWRDPFVFWNEEAKQYWMLIAARLKTGASRRRGCTALAVSTDLNQWQVRAPFWAP